MKVLRLDIFLSLPEKLLQLPVIQPAPNTLDYNIPGKPFAMIVQSTKTVKLIQNKSNVQYTYTYFIQFLELV